LSLISTATIVKAGSVLSVNHLRYYKSGQLTILIFMDHPKDAQLMFLV